MNMLKVLHSYWVGERHDSPRAKKSWKMVDEAVRNNLPQDKQKSFTSLLEDHFYEVEYQGFVAGFKMATEIWRKMM